MRRIALRALLGLVAVACLAVALPGSAEASPAWGGGYPAYTYEGQYPTIAGCSGTFSLNQQRTASWGGRTVRLKYFYSSRCGSFARIENAPRDCWAYLDRDADANRANGWAWVAESVDPGIDYAYTKIGNNLNGRFSRAALVCGNGQVLTRTNWY